MKGYISELYDHRINKWLAIEDEWERKKIKKNDFMGYRYE